MLSQLYLQTDDFTELSDEDLPVDIKPLMLQIKMRQAQGQDGVKKEQLNDFRVVFVYQVKYVGYHFCSCLDLWPI